MNAFEQIQEALNSDQFSAEQLQLHAQITEAAADFKSGIEHRINEISKMRTRIQHEHGLKIEGKFGWYNNYRNWLTFTELTYDGIDGEYLLLQGEYALGCDHGSEYYDNKDYKNFFHLSWLNMTNEQLKEIFTKEAEKDKELGRLRAQALARKAQAEQEAKDRELLKDLQKKYGA